MIQSVCQGLQCRVTMAGLELAFPDDYAMPAHILQFLNVLPVTLPVAFHLCLPEFSVGLGDSVEPASLMSVPETPVHKYACPILAQHQIRVGWKPVVVQPVAEPVRVKVLPDNHFRLGILAAYVLHAQVALGWGEAVWHVISCNSLSGGWASRPVFDQFLCSQIYWSIFFILLICYKP